MFQDLAALLSFALAGFALLFAGLSVSSRRPRGNFGAAKHLGYQSWSAAAATFGVAALLNGLAIVTGTPRLGVLGAVGFVAAAVVSGVADIARRRS